MSHDHDDHDWDAGKSIQDNTEAMVASLGAKVKRNLKDIECQDETLEELGKFQTRIEELDLKTFKKEFYEFREKTRTEAAVLAAKAKGDAARIALYVGSIASVLVAIATGVAIKLAGL